MTTICRRPTRSAAPEIPRTRAMKLYAFDVDDTLDISNGPVRLSDLRKLRDSGHIVGLCGNWGLVTLNVPDWHERVSFIGPVSGSKADFLIQLRTYVRAEAYVMVGNDPRIWGVSDDATASREAGFQFIREVEFAKGLR
jgi:hypothetical protein